VDLRSPGHTQAWNGRYETNLDRIDSPVPSGSLLQSCHEARGEKARLLVRACVVCSRAAASSPSKVISQRPRIKKGGNIVLHLSDIHKKGVLLFESLSVRVTQQLSYLCVCVRLVSDCKIVHEGDIEAFSEQHLNQFACPVACGNAIIRIKPAECDVCFDKCRGQIC
jgi:hypothetical protein